MLWRKSDTRSALVHKAEELKSKSQEKSSSHFLGVCRGSFVVVLKYLGIAG